MNNSKQKSMNNSLPSRIIILYCVSFTSNQKKKKNVNSRSFLNTKLNKKSVKKNRKCLLLSITSTLVKKQLLCLDPQLLLCPPPQRASPLQQPTQRPPFSASSSSTAKAKLEQPNPSSKKKSSNPLRALVKSPWKISKTLSVISSSIKNSSTRCCVLKSDQRTRHFPKVGLSDAFAVQHSPCINFVQEEPESAFFS